MAFPIKILQQAVGVLTFNLTLNALYHKPRPDLIWRLQPLRLKFLASFDDVIEAFC